MTWEKPFNPAIVKMLLTTSLILILGILGTHLFQSSDVNYRVEKCEVGFPSSSKLFEVIYNKSTKILIAYLWVNCCGIDITVEKDWNAYKIIEKQQGPLCKCMCKRRVIIFDVPEGAKIEFLDRNGNEFILTSGNTSRQIQR
jgi:hypothetical protein